MVLSLRVFSNNYLIKGKSCFDLIILEIFINFGLG